MIEANERGDSLTKIDQRALSPSSRFHQPLTTTRLTGPAGLLARSGEPQDLLWPCAKPLFGYAHGVRASEESTSMCGIYGYVGEPKQLGTIVVDALKTLEYR